MANQFLIGLITDFGSLGHYTASIKGVIFKINPKCNIIDISHEITPYSILEASYVLKATHKYFPQNTIFIIVVDPGVGSDREIIGIRTANNQFFIGPNNGVFSFLNTKNIEECIELTNDKYFNKPVSKTFHGRDIMAPMGAYLSKNIPLNNLGKIFDTTNLIKVESPISIEKKEIKCTVQYIDNFGNCITNLFLHDSTYNGKELVDGQKLILSFKNKEYQGIFTSHFNRVSENSLIFIKGSTSYLEISINRGNAANLIGFKVGDIIRIIF
jgi:S-adenosylmethionine hydrolase